MVGIYSMGLGFGVRGVGEEFGAEGVAYTVSIHNAAPNLGTDFPANLDLE